MWIALLLSQNKGMKVYKDTTSPTNQWIRIISAFVLFCHGMIFCFNGMINYDCGFFFFPPFPSPGNKRITKKNVITRRLADWVEEIRFIPISLFLLVHHVLRASNSFADDLARSNASHTNLTFGMGFTLGQSPFPFPSRASKCGFSSILHRGVEKLTFSMDEGRCQTCP